MNIFFTDYPDLSLSERDLFPKRQGFCPSVFKVILGGKSSLSRYTYFFDVTNQKLKCTWPLQTLNFNDLTRDYITIWPVSRVFDALMSGMTLL